MNFDKPQARAPKLRSPERVFRSLATAATSDFEFLNRDKQSMNDFRAMLTATICMMALVSETCLFADPPSEQKQIAALQKRISVIEGLVATQDAYVAFNKIEANGAPVQVVRDYMMFSRRYYTEHKDVARMLIFARAGIDFGLRHAKAVEQRDEKLARSLRAHAKAFAFNTAANAWPGWQDPGIEVTASDLVNGLDLARLNLRLARELKVSAQAQLNAHWLVGAHLMAAKQVEPAVKQFDLARELAKPEESPDYLGMIDGYTALARLSAKPNDKTLQGQLDVVVAKLKETKGEGKFFAQQIRTAAEVFAAASK